MRYLISINIYRSSTDDGPSNGWVIRECESRAVQDAILGKGLPVSDQVIIMSNGDRAAYYSRKGIRPVTRTERRWAEKQPYIPVIDMI